MYPLKQKSYTRILVNVLGIFAFVALAVLLFKWNGKEPLNQEVAIDTKTITHDAVDAATVPADMPNNAPFLGSGTVVENFSNTGQGKAQFVRKWVVDAPSSQVISEYKAFFANNGWVITTEHTAGNSTLIGAAKNAVVLSVNISSNGSAQSLIELTSHKTTNEH